MCPMEKYISTSRKPIDQKRRLRRAGVSWSSRAASSLAWLACLACPCRLAPYPASSTALMMSWLLAEPSTVIELVSRLTEQEETPATPLTAFSTCALHEAQLMPVT